MTTKEFIEKIANGTFSKNDVLIQSEVFPDKKDLLWDLWMADKACVESTGKPQITDEAEIARISNAIGWLNESIEGNTPGETKATDHKHQEHIVIPDEIANSPLAMELLNKCKGAGLLDENYQPIPSKNGKQGTTRFQLKEIASTIMWLCDIETTPKWKPFETLWAIRNLNTAKEGNGTNRAFQERKERIKKIFQPYTSSKNKEIKEESQKRRENSQKR